MTWTRSWRGWSWGDGIFGGSGLEPLQTQLMKARGWWALEPGLELCEFDYQAGNWGAPRRMVAIRQRVKLRETAPGKTLSLFKDDPDMKRWRYGGGVPR